MGFFSKRDVNYSEKSDHCIVQESPDTSKHSEDVEAIRKAAKAARRISEEHEIPQEQNKKHR